MRETLSTTPRMGPSRVALEDAILDVKGNLLLLDMVIDYVEDAASVVRPGADKPTANVLQVPLTEDRLAALAHARLNVIASVRDLEKLFYGE